MFGSAAVGTVSNLRAIKKLRAALPLKGARGLVVILLLLPGLVIIAAAGMAVAVTKLEDGWSKPTAFRFTISAMCGLGNPLTNQVPETALGKLAALGCASLQMAIGGIFVGLISDGCLKCCCCCARACCARRCASLLSGGHLRVGRDALGDLEENGELLGVDTPSPRLSWLR